MQPLQQNLRHLAVLAVPLLSVACADGHITAPELDPIAAPQLSVLAGGGQLFGTDGDGGTPSTLYSIDPTTGAATPVGPIGFDGVGGIAFAADGRLYGITGAVDGSVPMQLITIDPATGAGTLVGPTSGSGFRAIFDLSFRSADDVLFASGFGGGGSTGCVGLGTVDVGTGLATEVGTTGTCAPGDGLTFSHTGALYLANKALFGGPARLYPLDPGTGAATMPTVLTFPGFPAGSGELNALSTDPGTGTIYASVRLGSGVGGPYFLATVDPTTGVVTKIGQTVDGLDAIAWGSFDVTPPTVTAALVPLADQSLTTRKGTFTVEFSCADDRDPDATPTATLNGIPVENGQVVELRLKSGKSQKEQKSGKSGRTLKLKGPAFDLMAVCVDAAGNEGRATASPVFAEKSAKSQKP